jgi:hypothetical protein
VTTAQALAELQRPSAPTWSQRLTDGVVDWLAKHTTRRGFLVRSAVVGSALAVDTAGFALKPQTAYASVCGPGATCSSGWTVFCATVNNGTNNCPPGSIAAGWWKADGASLCGGRARYIVDCNALCSRCSTRSGRPGICSSTCWSCGCHCGPGGQCDQRRVCCNAFRYGQCNQQVSQVGSVVCRVVSCVPPWKFLNCSTASATDNATRDHSSPALPGPWSAIRGRYYTLGENGSALGASRYAEFAVPRGRAQRYVRGRMSYTSSRGARYTTGAITQRYERLGNEAGVLGFPVSDPLSLGAGWASRFEHGRVSWHPTLAAYETLGAIAVLYEKVGAERGTLGYPTATPRSAPDGTGRYSSFQRGRISWHPSTGAHWLGSALTARYGQLGAEGGRLGYPTVDETGVAGSRTARFQKGRIVHLASGANVEVYDVIDAAYARAGGEAGVLGLPVANEQPAGAGRAQQFATGRISALGGAAYWTRGPIAQRYVEMGAETGRFGFPTADETIASGVRTSVFEHGSISYDEATGEVTVGR